MTHSSDTTSHTKPPTIVLSDRWWSIASTKGEQHLQAQRYELAGIEFFRALKHIESLYQNYHRAVLQQHPIDIVSINKPFYIMYTHTCHRLAEAFYRQGDRDLTEHYLESAVYIMVQESSSFENTRHCRGCAHRHYEDVLNTLVEYLRYHQVAEQDIHERISTLILVAQGYIRSANDSSFFQSHNNAQVIHA